MSKNDVGELYVLVNDLNEMHNPAHDKLIEDA